MAVLPCVEKEIWLVSFFTLFIVVQRESMCDLDHKMKILLISEQLPYGEYWHRLNIRQ